MRRLVIDDDRLGLVFPQLPFFAPQLLGHAVDLLVVSAISLLHLDIARFGGRFLAHSPELIIRNSRAGEELQLLVRLHRHGHVTV
jgi:hypothetical protein